MKRTLIHRFDTYAREPVLRRLPDGSLMCLFLTGGPREPHNENVTMICRSYDGGDTWTEPEVLFSHHSRAVWCTEVFAECDPPFIAVHTYNAESWYRELQTFISYSFDGGMTWQEPASFPWASLIHFSQHSILMIDVTYSFVQLYNFNIPQ